MHITVAALLGLSLVACGGGKKEPKAPVAEAPVVEAKAEPAPPPPPPPQVFRATAALTPVKGAKIATVAVSFTQEEGGSTQVKAEIEGLKAGTYHLVIHDGAECGPNATKVGAAWAPGASAPLTLTVVKGAIGELDEAAVLPLAGDAPIVGHTLVLHEDKKGQPGKTVACGPIVLADAAPAE